MKAQISYRKHLLVSIFYLAVALIMFYPITLHMNTLIPGTGADPYEQLWSIWWVKYAVFNLHTSVYHTNLLFWPIGSNLAFSTIAPLNGIESAPFQIFGTVFAYNIIFFIGFVLSGISMFILAEYLTKNTYAAIIAGFIFTFSAFHLAQAYELVFINICWAPLFLYFFLRLTDDKGNRYMNIIGMSASFALSTLMGVIEQTIMIFLLLILMLILYTFDKATRKKIFSMKFAKSMTIFFVLAFIIGAWNFIPLINAVLQPGGLGVVNNYNRIIYDELWSTNPIAYFTPGYYNAIFYNAVNSSGLYQFVYYPDAHERAAYIGVTVLVLMFFAIIRDKRKMFPWAVGAFVFAWLAVGPAFGLYVVYHAIPGLNVIREPGRFNMITTMFIAILAAYGTKLIFDYINEHYTTRKQRRKMTYLVLAIILALMFIENNTLQIGNSPRLTTNIAFSPIYYKIANMSGNFSILELPIIPYGASEPWTYPGEATLDTSITHKPLVGGYVSRVNSTLASILTNIPIATQTFNLLMNGTANYTIQTNKSYENRTISILKSYNTKFVIVQKAAFNQQELAEVESNLENTFGNPIYNDNTTMAFDTSAAINGSMHITNSK